jgi:tetratricopeptide (TPR) repeat protein
MTNKNIYQIVILLLFPIAAFSQSIDNAELKKMYDGDQGSRMVSTIDWAQLSKNDNIRENRVYELIKEGKIVTGKDYYHSAMIFQHGKDSVAYGMAVKQMKKAIELDPTINKWLLAAAIDRDLMSRSKSQIYGTQYVKKGQDGKWERYKIDTTQVTAEERKYYNVETLAEQVIKERNMNLLTLSDFYAKTNSLDQIIKLLKTERKKGDQSLYNTSEKEINSFGYLLMKSKKLNDALTIFSLNTNFYPTGFNTYDSLGECLFLLNKKDRGLKAYRKSLELNPQNDNAKKILSGQK